MTQLERRLDSLETKKSPKGGVVLTLIRRVVEPDNRDGLPYAGPWTATFHPVGGSADPDVTFTSEAGESEEDFRRRLQDIADQYRGKSKVVRFVMTEADGDL